MKLTKEKEEQIKQEVREATNRLLDKECLYE